MEKSNIVVGLVNDGTIKIGTYGAAESAAVDVGYIKGGVEVSCDETQVKITPDQAIGPVRAITTEKSYKVKFTVEEATFANIAIAFGLPSTVISGDKMSFGAISADVEKTLFINVKGEEGATRKYTIWKARPTGKSATAYKRDSETTLEMEFEALYDEAQTAGEEFMIIERTGGDTTPPTVAMTTPAPSGTVAKDTTNPIVLTFTESGIIKQSTIVYGDTVHVLNTTGGTMSLVAGTLVYSATAKTLTFTPSASWTASDTLEVLVTTGVQDGSGNKLATPYIATLSVTA